MPINNRLVYINIPKGQTSFLDYLLITIYFFIIKVTLGKKVVLNLPLEIQYPYIFYQFWKGEEFINFAERLKKILGVNLYWQNNHPAILDKFGVENLPISWDLVPDNIDLVINNHHLKKSTRRKYIKTVDI